MSGRRFSRLAAITALLATVGVGVFASPAAAHATLSSSDPAPDSVIDTVPAEISMTFTEPVTALAGSVRLFDPDGDRADAGVPTTSSGGTVLSVGVDDAGEGTYTVSWRVTSDDGHTITGSWVFHVGSRTGAADVSDDGDPVVGAAGWVGRVLSAGGLIGVIGVAVAALTGVISVSAVTGRSASASGASNTGSSAARRLWVWAAALMLAGSVVVLLTRAAEATGASLLSAPADVFDVVSSSRSGLFDALRVAASVVIAGLVVLWRDRRCVLLVTMWAVAAAVLSAAAGHPAVTAAPAVSVPLDGLHVVAVGAWLGGLAVILVASRSQISVQRWSAVAGVAVLAVALTGAASALFQLGAPRGLWETTYGRLLGAKVALVAVMGILGWLNRQHLTALSERGAAAVRRVRAETFTGVAVLALTGVLVATVPASDALSRPFDGSTRVGDMNATFTVAPARVGTNQIHIIFTGATGGPGAVDAAELSVQGPGVEPMRVPLTPIASNHYTATAATFGTPGSWTLNLTAVVAGVPADGSVTVPVA